MKRILFFLAGVLLLSPGVASAQPFECPVLDVMEPELGSWTFSCLGGSLIPLTVTSGEALDFSWVADAPYGGTVTGYRYGWDVSDPDDANDPGWAIPWTADLLSAPTHSFITGVHNFFVMARDQADSITRAGFMLTVEGGVPREKGSWGSLKSVYGD